MMMKLGKKPVRFDKRTLFLANYNKDLAPPPPSCDLTAKMSNLGMMGNDTLGDCTCAAVGHIIQTWTAEVGNQVIIPDQDIVALYEEVSGYNPNDPNSDQGAVELDVLNYWKAHPVDGNQLSSYVALNTQNMNEIMQAIFFFGGSYIGIQLPLTAPQQTLWTVVSQDGNGKPGSWGGHAVPVVAYDGEYVTCITWGALLKMTWDFFAYYCDEAYALLSPDIVGGGQSPEGFNLDQLTQDLSEITT